MLIIKQHTVPHEINNIRLLDYALEVFTAIASRSSLKKIIKRGEIRIDGLAAGASEWIHPGMCIEWVDMEHKVPKPLDIPLEVVYEDDHLAVINKPAGIEVSGNKYYTIQNALIGKLKDSSEADRLKWPRPVHRLDAATSGLLLVSKTASSHMKLGQMFQEKTIQKTYRAVVAAALPDSGRITRPVNGQDALTEFDLISVHHCLKTNQLSLVSLRPLTGRTHQLRIHMAGLGAPIVGDKLYGEGPLLKGKGLFLAAVSLSFYHPHSQDYVCIEIDQPTKFDALLERESRRWIQYKG